MGSGCLISWWRDSPVSAIQSGSKRLWTRQSSKQGGTAEQPFVPVGRRVIYLIRGQNGLSIVNLVDKKNYYLE